MRWATIAVLRVRYFTRQLQKHFFSSSSSSHWMSTWCWHSINGYIKKTKSWIQLTRCIERIRFRFQRIALFFFAIIILLFIYYFGISTSIMFKNNIARSKFHISFLYVVLWMVQVSRALKKNYFCLIVDFVVGAIFFSTWWEHTAVAVVFFSASYIR